MTSTSATATDAKFQIAATANSGDSITLTNDAFTNIGVGTTAVTEATSFTFTSDLSVGQSITIAGRKVTGTTGVALAADVLTAFATGNTTATNSVVSGALANFTMASVGGKLVVTSTTAGAAVADVVVSTVGNPGFTFSTVQGGAQSGGRAETLSTNIATFSTNLGDSSTTEATFQTSISNIITAANAYITDLNTQRTKLGAFQNQLESSVNNVSDLSVNLSSARSRILDTDYATETAALTKGQILQQAATAMLAQANQMPNVILSLLK